MPEIESKLMVKCPKITGDEDPWVPVVDCLYCGHFIKEVKGKYVECDYS